MSADPEVCGICGEKGSTRIPLREPEEKFITFCPRCTKDVNERNLDDLTTRWVEHDNLYDEMQDLVTSKEAIWTAARDTMAELLGDLIPAGYVVPADFRTLPADGKLRRVILG